MKDGVVDMDNMEKKVQNSKSVVIKCCLCYKVGARKAHQKSIPSTSPRIPRVAYLALQATLPAGSACIRSLLGREHFLQRTNLSLPPGELDAEVVPLRGDLCELALQVGEAVEAALAVATGGHGVALALHRGVVLVPCAVDVGGWSFGAGGGGCGG